MRGKQKQQSGFVAGLIRFLVVVLIIGLVLCVKWLITANALDMKFSEYMANIVWPAIRDFGVNTWNAIKSLYQQPIA